MLFFRLSTFYFLIYSLSLAKVIDISAGADASYFVFSDGSLWAMGNNESGQLGDGTTVKRDELTKIVDSNVSKVSAGGSHALFIKTDGSLWGMGGNHKGQLGLGNVSVKPISTPVEIYPSGVVEVDAPPNSNRSYFLKNNGTLWAMGYSVNWFTDSGSAQNVATPIKLADNVSSFSCGTDHLLYLSEDNKLYSKGIRNSDGQLGDGSTTALKNNNYFLDTDVISFSAKSYNSAFVKNDGSLYVFGSNQFGQLGDDGSSAKRLTPYKLINAGVTEVYCGGSRFKKSDGSLWGMGYNSQGQLGLGDRETAWVPRKISNFNFTKVTNDMHYLYQHQDGSVWATGQNNYYQLGLNFKYSNLLEKIIESTGENHSQDPDTEDGIDNQWGWFHWPWVFMHRENDWFYFATNSSNYYIYSNNKKSWYFWDLDSRMWLPQ